MAYADAMMGAGRIARRRPAGYGTAPGTDFNDRTSLAGAEGSAYGSAAGYGDAANAGYFGQLQNFNAADSLNNYAKGAFGSISDALRKEIGGITGSAVGAGRFDSGFVDEDQVDAFGRATNQLSNAIAGQSMNALNAQQANTQALGAFGARQQETANDLLTSRREELENNAREEEERKRKKRSGIGGAIGGVIGAGIGSFIPGVGTAIGAGLGSSLGAAF